MNRTTLLALCASLGVFCPEHSTFAGASVQTPGEATELGALHEQSSSSSDTLMLSASRTYGALTVPWSRWAYGQPPSVSPAVLGSDCTAGQQGPVWFLAGNLANEATTRNCTVPRGKTLFIPLAVNTYISTPQIGNCTRDPWFHNSKSPSWLAALANIEVSDPRVLFRLDGQRAPTLIKVYARSPSFNIKFPDDNIGDLICGADAPAGWYGPVVSYGLWVKVPPLSPGRHTIRWKASFTYDAGPLGQGTNSQDVTYRITVPR